MRLHIRGPDTAGIELCSSPAVLDRSARDDPPALVPVFGLQRMQPQSPGGKLEPRVRILRQIAGDAEAAGRGDEVDVDVGEAALDRLEGRDLVAVGGQEEDRVDLAVIDVRQGLDGQIDVGLLLLVEPAVALEPAAVFLDLVEPGQNDLDAHGPERVDVVDVAFALARVPGVVGGGEDHPFQRLVRPQVGGGEAVDVEPLQGGLIEGVDGVVEVESIDVPADAKRRLQRERGRLRCRLRPLIRRDLPAGVMD